MAENSHIQWTDSTWNVATGCTKVSDGCLNCYISTTPPFRMAGRKFDRPGIGGATDLQLHPERLEWPLRWRKPRRIFVNSLSDLFHARVPREFIAQAWEVMERTPQHTYQVLTKRPERLARVLDGLPLLPNVWLGTSIESDQYVRRADALRAAPAAVRFISAEPLIGAPWSLDLTGIDWLIAGGESGPKARPMELDWVRFLLELCEDSGTAPFVKQLGSVWASGLGADKKGGAWSFWPEDLRVRQYPAGSNRTLGFEPAEGSW